MKIVRVYMQDGEAKAAFVALTTRTGKVLFFLVGVHTVIFFESTPVAHFLLLHIASSTCAHASSCHADGC